MPTYKIILLPTALESLKKMDRRIGNRILDKLEWLSENFDHVEPLPLKGELGGLYKLRVGNWRVVYEADKDALEIIVHYVGHRRQIYKIQSEQQNREDIRNACKPHKSNPEEKISLFVSRFSPVQPFLLISPRAMNHSRRNAVTLSRRHVVTPSRCHAVTCHVRHGFVAISYQP